jgi:hypothetical protein
MKQFILESDLSSTTKRAYISIVNTLEKKLGTTILNIIENPNIYYKHICSNSNENSSCRNNLKVLMSLMNRSQYKQEQKQKYDIWYKYFIDVSKKVEKENDNNIQTVKSLNWEDVLKVLDEKINNDVYDIYLVTLALYTLIPPRRQKDYWKIYIVEEEQTSKCNIEECTGYIYLENGILEIHDFKTAKSKFKPWTKQLPEKLVTIIKTYIQNRPINSNYLFCKRSGEPYKTLYSFTDANNSNIKTIFNNSNISINSLRHAAATWVNNNISMTRAEKKQFANDMGHSFNMQQEYVEAIVKK